MRNQTPPKAHYLFLIVLFVALLNGVIFVFLVPPWQHNDEPNHFEYAWWLANNREKLGADDYDQEMRREVLLSMLDHGFFRGMGWEANPDVTDSPIWIGNFSQADEPFLYYTTAAIPLYILKGQDIDLQLYAARMVSLVWLLVTVMCAYGIVVELTTTGNPLRWMVPISLALLPGFVDLMTAVNNDVGAIAASSMSLWVGVRHVRRGIQPLLLILSGILVIVCIFTKETAYPAVIMLFLSILLAILVKGKMRQMAWILIGALVLVMGMASFAWGDAADWYRNTYQRSTTRLANEDLAPLGRAFFRLEGGELEGNKWINKIEQVMSYEDIVSLHGQPVTIGAWIWENRDEERVRISLTALLPDGSYNQGAQVFMPGQEPAFYAFEAAMPKEAVQAWVTVTAEGYGTFYLDGMVLAAGTYALDVAPQPADAANDSGVWDGETFTNILRGSSAEKSWPRVQTWVDRIGSAMIPDRGRPSIILYSLLDREAGGWYYDITLKSMQQSFWGKFGWGHVPFFVGSIYSVLSVISMMGVLGIIVALFGKWEKIPWDGLIFMGLMMALVWMTAIVRGAFYLFSWRFIPTARYAYPAVIPTLGLLCLGWWQLSKKFREIMWTHHLKRIPVWVGMVSYWSVTVGLNLLGIASILKYYYS